MRHVHSPLYLSLFCLLMVSSATNHYGVMGEQEMQAEDDDSEMSKRGWNNFHAGYGKRAWNNFAAGYGKRSYEDLDDAESAFSPYAEEDLGDEPYELYKRAWNSGFQGMGKRAWNSGFQGMGKRAWNSGFQGMGKRAWNSGFGTGMGKRAWNSGFQGMGKRAWNSGFQGMGKRAWNSGFGTGMGKRAWNSGFAAGMGKRSAEFQDSSEDQGVRT